MNWPSGATCWMRSNSSCSPTRLMAGHAEIRTTEVYLRTDPSEKLEAVEAVVPAGAAARAIQSPGRVERLAAGRLIAAAVTKLGWAARFAFSSAWSRV